MNATTAKLQSYIKLEMPRFRHAVLVAACISVVVVLVLSPVVNEAAKSVGLTASLGVLVFLVSVLLDHVASLKAHPTDLESTELTLRPTSHSKSSCENSSRHT